MNVNVTHHMGAALICTAVASLTAFILHAVNHFQKQKVREFSCKNDKKYQKVSKLQSVAKNDTIIVTTA